jgi:hypothetical protein
MRFYQKAEEAATNTLKAFEKPTRLPPPADPIFLRWTDEVPCRSWPWQSQVVLAVQGHADGRTPQQWVEVERRVKEGEMPLRGFKNGSIFGYEQTEGEPVPRADPEMTDWLASLPLRCIADRWGYSVQAFNGEDAKFGGAFHRGMGIALGVKNLAAWAHELVHAADHRSNRQIGPKWQKEIVAQLGGAVLLRVFGLDHEADFGGCWRYLHRFAEKEGIEVGEACGMVLERTCAAVALICETAESIGSDGRRQF